MDEIAYRARRLPSPLGELFAVVDGSGALVRLDFVGRRARDERELERLLAPPGARTRRRLEWEPSALGPVARALERYFAGKARTFDLALAPEGTPFQRRVWRALLRVPFGETVGYAELAREAGVPRAARAVGRANATNPISIVVPCHRVVGSNGHLTGFAGGLENKAWLLDHELRVRAGC